MRTDNLPRWKRHWNLLGIPRFGIDHKYRISATVIEQPHEDHVPIISIHSCNSAPMITDRCRYTMMPKSVAQFLTIRIGHTISLFAQEPFGVIPFLHTVFIT